MISPKKLFSMLRNKKESKSKANDESLAEEPKTAEKIEVLPEANSIEIRLSEKSETQSVAGSENQEIKDRPTREIVPFLLDLQKKTAPDGSLAVSDVKQIICPSLLLEEEFKKVVTKLARKPGKGSASKRKTLNRLKSFNDADVLEPVQRLELVPLAVTLIALSLGSTDDKLSACLFLFDPKGAAISIRDLKGLLICISKIDILSEELMPSSSAILRSTTKSNIRLKNDDLLKTSFTIRFKKDEDEEIPIDPAISANILGPLSTALDTSEVIPDAESVDLKRRETLGSDELSKKNSTVAGLNLDSVADISDVPVIQTVAAIIADLNLTPTDTINISALLSWIHRYPSKIHFINRLKYSNKTANKTLAKRLFAIEEKTQIENIFKYASIEVDSTCYIISTKWYKLWVDYVQFYFKNSKVQALDDLEVLQPSEIDNNCLLENPDAPDGELLHLQTNLVEGSDYTVLPEEAWNALATWYGGGPVIKRRAFRKTKKSLNTQGSFLGLASTHLLNNLQFFTNVQVDLYPLALHVASTTDTNVVKLVVTSRYHSLETLKKMISEAVFDQSTHCDLFVVKNEREVKITESNQTIIDNIELLVNKAFVLCQKSVEPQANLIIDRETHQKLDLGEGLVGLQNLGNTCYLNAATQCLLQLRPLTNYFLFDHYKKEVKGRELILLEHFVSFAKEVWHEPTGTVCIPRNLKAAVSSIAPQFAGFSQHDAQEVLSLILDSLHEDLNRVVAKEYKANPEWNGETDEAFSKVFWENHLSRDTSMIVNLFHGQLKSAIECATCRKKSINFEAFLFLTVPVPTTSFRTIKVTVMPLDSLPRTCSLRVPIDGTMSELLVSWKSTNPKALKKKDYMIVDVQGYYVFNMIKKYRNISEIRDKDTIYLYEYKAGEMMRVDSEISLSSTGTNGRRIYGSYTRMHFVHRKYKDEWWRGKSHSPKLFSHPLICFINDPVGKPLQAMEIYKIVARRLESMYGLNLFVREEHEELGTMSSNDSNESEYIPYPFIIKLTSRNGKTCRQCTQKDCSGCILLYSTDTISLGWDDTFALDWSSQLSKSKEHMKQDLFAALERVEKVKIDENSSNVVKVDLADCLERFQTPEHLPNDFWYCSNCKEHKACVKAISIYRAPLILIIQINRFKVDGWNLTKNTTLVKYPLELDMSKYLPGADEPVLYELCGVVNHEGEIHSGHYTSYNKSSVRNDWYLFDDENLYRMDNPKDVINENGYILFYQRKNIEKLLETACVGFL